MDITVLDKKKKIASSLREKFNQTERVAWHIAEGHEVYEWPITLYNMKLS
jgi:hypothetical protein